MKKQLLVFSLALCLCTLLGFTYSQPEKAFVSKKEGPAAIIQLSRPATLMPGSVPVTVEFDFQTVGNVILAARIYLSTDPCLQCLVSGFTGGPINFAGGSWRTVNPVVVTCTSGTVTVSGTLSSFGVICDIE